MSDNQFKSSAVNPLSYLEKSEKNLLAVQTDEFHLFRKDKCKSIDISHTMLGRDLVSVKLGLNTGQDESQLKTALVGRYECVIGGTCVLNQGVQFDTNLLPTDYIFPVGSGLTHQEFKICINFDHVPDDVWEAVSVFKVLVEWTQLSDQVMVKTDRPYMTMLPMSIPWNGQTLDFKDGIAQPGSNSLLFDEKVVCGLRLAIVSRPHSLYPDDHQVVCALSDQRYDMSQYRETMTYDHIEAVQIVEGGYRVCHVLGRIGCTMSNFTVHSSNGVEASNAYISIGQRKVLLTDLDDENHVGLINKMYNDVCIVIEYPADIDIHNISTHSHTMYTCFNPS